jgi:nitrite reductase (NADH) small subunit
MPYVKLASVSELPPDGEAREFSCGDRTICLANIAGSYSGMDNVCLHRGGPLGQGVVESGKVVCPWHGWAWDPQTGEAVHNSSAKVSIYPIKIEGVDVLVEI